MSKNKAKELQHDLEYVLGKKGSIKTLRDGGHYVQVAVGGLTLDFFLGDDLTLEQRRKEDKVCQFTWKKTMHAVGCGSAMSDWSIKTISHALVQSLKVVSGSTNYKIENYD